MNLKKVDNTTVSEYLKTFNSPKSTEKKQIFLTEKNNLKKISKDILNNKTNNKVVNEDYSVDSAQITITSNKIKSNSRNKSKHTINKEEKSNLFRTYKEKNFECVEKLYKLEKLNKNKNICLLDKKFKQNSNEDNKLNKLNNSNNFKKFLNENNIKTLFQNSKSLYPDTITDVNGVNEDINNHKNFNTTKQNKRNLSNINIFFKNKVLTENQIFDNQIISSLTEFNNYKINSEDKDNRDSSKINLNKEDHNLNNKIRESYLKEFKEKNSYKIETPKFKSKKFEEIQESKSNDFKNSNFCILIKKIDDIKENSLFLVNNISNNIITNSIEVLNRKFFEYTLESFFPQFFVIEKDLNGIIKIDSLYSFLFYLRVLKNMLFSNENKLKFSNFFS